MRAATEIDALGNGLFVWQAYDPEVKADLFSTAISTSAGLYVVDGIPLPEDVFREATGDSQIAGVVVTNTNHARAAVDWSNRFGARLLAHASTVREFGWSAATELSDGSKIGDELTVIAIPGAPEGEIALHASSGAGRLVVGDALINFGSYGFSLLPAKYCDDAPLMRKSLFKLLQFEFEQILFAHGIPVLSKAHDRLEGLLNS